MKTITINFTDGTIESFEHCFFDEVSDGLLEFEQLTNDPTKTFSFKEDKDTIKHRYILKNIVGYITKTEIEYENKLKALDNMGLINKRT